MNLLVWLLFLVGTWPVVRWALQSRSHDMQKHLWKLSLGWAVLPPLLSHARFARSRCPTHGRDVQCADVEVSWSTWRVGGLGEWHLGDPVSCF